MLGILKSMPVSTPKLVLEVVPCLQNTCSHAQAATQLQKKGNDAGPLSDLASDRQQQYQ